MDEVVSGFAHIEKEVERQVDAVGHLVAIHSEVYYDDGQVGDEVEDPGPPALSQEDLLHPNVVILFILNQQGIVEIVVCHFLILFVDTLADFICVDCRAKHKLDKVCAA